MKKMLCLILAILSLTGCAYGSSECQNPIYFYYLCLESSYLPEDLVFYECCIDGKEIGSSLSDILEFYLKGPSATEEAVSPFPAGTKLVGVEGTETRLYVTLSSELASLSGVQLTLACACLAKTCFPLCNAKYIRIQAYGCTLNGADYMEFNVDSIIATGTGSLEKE